MRENNSRRNFGNRGNRSGSGSRGRDNRRGNRGSGSGNGFRRNNSGFRRNNFDRGPREMHDAKCAKCGKECQVPFKPTEGRPVYCSECFKKEGRR